MPNRKRKPAGVKNADATVGYEAQLWQMADALRGSMEAAEYKHVKAPHSFFPKMSSNFMVGFTESFAL